MIFVHETQSAAWYKLHVAQSHCPQFILVLFQASKGRQAEDQVFAEPLTKFAGLYPNREKFIPSATTLQAPSPAARGDPATSS